jgi:hypothetical protein
MVEWVAFLLLIWEFLSSNIDLGTEIFVVILQAYIRLLRQVRP